MLSRNHERVVSLVAILLMLGARVRAERVVPSFPAVDAEPLGAVPKEALVLHDGWRIKDAALDGDGATVSQIGYAVKDWFETTVPTTVLGTLVRHGVYPDPYIGTNNMVIPDACEEHNKKYDLAKFSHLPDKTNPWLKPWWFRTEFQVPDNYAGRTVWLHLDGINYRAEVWVNGARLASTNEVVGMFRRFRWDVTKLVKPGAPNALAVRIQGPDYPGNPNYEPIDGLAGNQSPCGGDRAIFKNVTQCCAVGWDWVRAARDRNMGLWQHVWLETTGPVAVRDPAAFTDVKLPGGEAAAVTVRTFLEPVGSRERRVEVVARLAPDGFEGATVEVRKKVVLQPGVETEITLSPQEFTALMVRQPRLWWPVTYGEQPLYRLTVEAWTDGKLSSTASSQFGMRTVGTTILSSGGRAWTVNGRVIRMTGGHIVPDFLMSWSAQRYRDEARLLAHGNHTVVRVNGCGIIMPEAFLAECDRQGVLIWHDLVRTSPASDGLAEVAVPVYLANMEDSIRRLRGHASLLVYCGCNEAATAENIGRALQDEMLPRLDGTRPWIVSSGTNAKWAKEEIKTISYGPYSVILLPEYFNRYRTSPSFVSKNEIGLPSMPGINQVAQFIPDLDQPDPAMFPLNRTMGYHDAAGGFFRALDGCLHTCIGKPATLAEYLAMADLCNSVYYRAIFEAANNARPRNAGTHLWKVNAAMPCFMWQVYDWYLRPNAGYYSLRSACKPLHIQASLEDFTVQVVITERQAKPGLTARISVVGPAGNVEAEERRAVDVPADATINIGPLPAIVQDGNVHFVALCLLDSQGVELDRTVIWLQKDHRWQDLLKAPPVAVTAQLLGQEMKGVETTYRFRVVNTSQTPATQVWLEILRGSLGEEVLPCFWSDNALTMLPGEAREVTVTFRTNLLAGAKPYLAIGGWNVTPRETDLNGGTPTPMKLAVSSVEMKDGQELTFTAEQVSAKGSRLTTWPVPVWLDGKVVRHIQVALRSGASATISCLLMPLTPGRHTFRVGDAEAASVIVNAPPVLWTIGQQDGDCRDLHFHPGEDYTKRTGANFIVGISDPAKDWPAVHPGPTDKWAGSQTFTNTVIFRADATQAELASCLVLKLMDCHPTMPPTLDIILNGCRSELQLPRGHSNDSVQDPRQCRPFRRKVVFPEGTLKAGENVLQIINRQGSWLVYDGLEFRPAVTPARAGQSSQLIGNLNAGKPQTVVTYGTSLTFGGAWVGQMKDALKKKYKGLITVINSGKCSMWSKWGVDNLDALVIQKKPDTVFIEFAMNDAFLTYKTSVAEARKNLLNMIDRIKAAKPDTEIILMTMNPPIGVHLERRPKIADYVQMYRDVAKERTLRLIDNYPNWERILRADAQLYTKYVPDGIHPGPEGYRNVVTPLILQSLGLESR